MVTGVMIEIQENLAELGPKFLLEDAILYLLGLEVLHLPNQKSHSGFNAEHNVDSRSLFIGCILTQGPGNRSHYLECLF